MYYVYVILIVTKESINSFNISLFSDGANLYIHHTLFLIFLVELLNDLL